MLHLYEAALTSAPSLCYSRAPLPYLVAIHHIAACLFPLPALSEGANVPSLSQWERILLFQRLLEGLDEVRISLPVSFMSVLMGHWFSWLVVLCA